MTTVLRPGFTGSPLDRVEHIRTDPALVDAAFRDPEARLLRLDGVEPVLDDTGGLGWTGLEERGDGPIALLGLIDGKPCFTPLAAEPEPPGRSRGLFAMLDTMRASDAATFGAARSLISWHAKHGFCANCGSPMPSM